MSALSWSCCVAPGASSSRGSIKMCQRPFLEFSNLTHLDVKFLKMLK